MDIRKNNLETRIMRILGYHGLIKKEELTRPVIYYEPRDRGKGYRKLRSGLIKLYPHLVAIALGTAGAMAILDPDLRRIAAGIGGGAVAAWAAGAVIKSLAPIDRFLYYNPTDIAVRHFRNEAGIPPHQEAYDYFQRKKPQNVHTLDDYVIMAETSSAVKKIFRHSDFQRTLGIIIGGTADFLNEIKINNSFPGLRFRDFIRMLKRQEELGIPEDTKKVKRLCTNYSSSQLSKMLKKLEKGKDPINLLEKYAKRKNLEYSSDDIEALKILKRHYEKGEFVLNIFEAIGEYYIGSEISKGQLIVENTGPYAGSYAGKHSKEFDCPRIFVRSDVGYSFMEGASRGFGGVGGDAGHGAFKDSTGGIVCVSGNVGHSFCRGMTDVDWPAIGICKGSLERKLYHGDVEDGMIVCLNINNENPPAYYFFEKGILRQEKTFEDNYDGLMEIMGWINAYVGKWVKKD